MARGTHRGYDITSPETPEYDNVGPTTGNGNAKTNEWPARQSHTRWAHTRTLRHSTETVLGGALKLVQV